MYEKPDPYEVLGISKSATLSEIRSAHRKLILRCHPDKVQDPNLKATKQAEFQVVQEAYELLGDDARRKEYDVQQNASNSSREPKPRSSDQYGIPRSRNNGYGTSDGTYDGYGGYEGVRNRDYGFSNPESSGNRPSSRRDRGNSSNSGPYASGASHERDGRYPGYSPPRDQDEYYGSGTSRYRSSEEYSELRDQDREYGGSRGYSSSRQFSRDARNARDETDRRFNSRRGPSCSQHRPFPEQGCFLCEEVDRISATRDPYTSNYARGFRRNRPASPPRSSNEDYPRRDMSCSLHSPVPQPGCRSCGVAEIRSARRDRYTDRYGDSGDTRAEGLPRRPRSPPPVYTSSRRGESPIRNQPRGYRSPSPGYRSFDREETLPRRPRSPPIYRSSSGGEYTESQLDELADILNESNLFGGSARDRYGFGRR